MDDGYYWCAELDGTKFVALLEAGSWYVPGLRDPVADLGRRLVCPVHEPDDALVGAVHAALLREPSRPN